MFGSFCFKLVLSSPGLTLPSFWIRLSQEYKRLNTVTITGAAAAETDTTSKAFRKAAWESALRNAKIELYALPEPRDVIPQHEYTDLENYAFRDATGPTSPAGKRKRPDDDEDGAEEGDNAVSMEDTEMEEPRRSKADNSYTHGWKQVYSLFSARMVVNHPITKPGRSPRFCYILKKSNCDIRSIISSLAFCACRKGLANPPY